MHANGIVRRKKTHPYCILFSLYSQKRKKGVNIDVYSKPRGRKTELRKKYRMANGKYLFILVGFAIHSAGLPGFSSRNYTFCYKRDHRLSHIMKSIFKTCSLFLSLFRCQKLYERMKLEDSGWCGGFLLQSVSALCPVYLSWRVVCWVQQGSGFRF